MSNLNRDILYLIFEQIQNDKKTLFSCLLVNKTWCEIIIPMLWRNPWERLNSENGMILLNVINSHLSDVTKNKIREHMIFTDFDQKPLFNYISYCKHLNLDEIQRIIDENVNEKSEISNIQNEIFNIFINENMKYSHLYVYQNFDSQINFINGAERCFSEIEFLSCNTDVNDNIITILTETCKSIRKLELFINLKNNNYGIIKLIEDQKKLSDISLTRTHFDDSSFYEILENSLTKHASTIQFCKFTRSPTKLLSSCINLKKLELGSKIRSISTSWYCLKDLSFPYLQILRSSSVPVDVMTSLIINTKGFLVEIKIDCIWYDETRSKILIQAIYQNCPNIKYLKLKIGNCSILELEPLLISCKYLKVLFLLIGEGQFDWNKLFEIFTKSSSSSLYKFKFNINGQPKLESYKLFFDNWKGRHPMFLQIFSNVIIDFNFNIIERYKKEGIIKKFDSCYWWDQGTKDFEFN
ncbi:hypothetical protein RhiirC2_853496 [Rhizophagus irregularis]|uniref:F-box domain-containing protein n=1 Tax=Rhizophagus irregularis TaxID=588596 RepID=A0A2N1MVA9_9GLOM|nr:hypothetical protein RhiirC2_853496 [Rhizophagus irregularis]